MKEQKPELETNSRSEQKHDCIIIVLKIKSEYTKSICAYMCIHTKDICLCTLET